MYRQKNENQSWPVGSLLGIKAFSAYCRLRYRQICKKKTGKTKFHMASDNAAAGSSKYNAKYALGEAPFCEFPLCYPFLAAINAQSPQHVFSRSPLQASNPPNAKKRPRKCGIDLTENRKCGVPHSGNRSCRSDFSQKAMTIKRERFFVREPQNESPMRLRT